MDLVIHTYGYFDALYYVLQGLAMFRNSGFYTTLVTSITIITGCYWGILMAYSPGSSGANWRGHLLKIFGMVIMVNSLLLPKANMILKDHVTKRIGKIDNIPLAFALPVGIIEEFGYVITRGFEQAFMPIEVKVTPDSPVFSYYNYGMLFGQRLRQEVASVRIKDPEFTGNMQRFIKRCVVLPAMIGTQFTTRQLFKTNDIWKLVSSKAGTLTRVEIDNNGKRVSVNCKDAAKHFEQYFANENKRIFAKYSNSDFGMANSGSSYSSKIKNNSLNTILQKNIKTLYGGQTSAKKILQQQMMINSLSNYKSSNSSSYGMARARMQQESGWLLSSKLAALYLPMMLVVFKSIVYSAFIFLVPMLIISGGFAKYKGYLTVVASLQLWPALNAVINMIIGTYSNLHLKANSGMLISFSTASSINNHIDSIVAVASGLQMVIPFLAIWMTQLGMGGLMHLAGNIVGGLQSTSGAIGSELASGNRSFDNIHENNLQRGIHSSNKTDYNLQYAAGASTYQHGDGTRELTTPRGRTSFHSGANINTSTGLAKANIEQSMHHQINEGIHQSQSLINADSRSLSDSREKAFNKTVDLVSHIAQREAAGESFNYESMGEQGIALQKAVNHARNLRINDSVSWKELAEGAVKAQLTVGYRTPSVSPVNVDASVTTEGSVSSSSGKEKLLSDDTTISIEDHTNKNYSNLLKAASNENWAKDNSIDNSLSRGVRENYNESLRLEKQLSRRYEQLDSWNKAKNIMQSSGGSISRDIYHDIENKLKEDYNLTGKEAHDLIDKGDSRAMYIANKIISDKTTSLVGDIASGKIKTSATNAGSSLDSFTQSNQSKVSDKNLGNRAKSVAKKEGINVDEDGIKNKINQQKVNLQNKQQQIQGDNSKRYDDTKTKNEQEAKKISKNLKKAREINAIKRTLEGMPD